MTKFKYKLKEQESSSEDETGVGNVREKKDLVLIAKGEYSINDIIDILNDPKNYSKVFTKKSSELENIELDIYGYKNIPANNKKNRALLDAQKEKYGEPFYKQLEKETGDKFTGIQSSGFPPKSKSNDEIVKKYASSTIDKPLTKLDLKWEKLEDREAIKFFTDNISITTSKLESILSNAGLTSGKDYSLGKKLVDENKLRNIVKELINENSLFNLKPDLAFKIYDILKTEYPQIGNDYTKSSFFYFINDKLK